MVGDPGRYAVPQVGQQLGQALADLPDAYMKGREQKRTRAMQDMFLGGLPQNEDGSTNWTAALQRYLQEGSKIGGGQFVGQYVPQLLDEEQARNAAAIARGEPVGPSAFFGPAPGQANAPAGSGNLQPRPQSQGAPQGQPQPPAAQPQQSGPRFRQLAASYRLGKDAIDSLGRVLKIDPEMPLSPQQVVAVRRAIEEELPKASTGAQPGRGAPSEVNQPAEGTSAADDAMNGGSRPPFMGGGTSGAPATPGGRAPNAVAQAGPGGMATVDNAGAGGTPGGVPGLRPTPVGTEAEARQQELVASRKEAAAAYLSKRNPTGSKDLMEQAQAARKRASEIRASLGEYNKPTTEQMNAAGQPLPEFERGKALSTKMGEAQAGVLKEFVDAGRSAQKRIQSLDTIGDALKRGGGNITTGPFAEHALHAKEALSSLFNIDFAGTPEAEVANKTGFSLATQAVKEISQRPSQMEFKLAMQNNPGLLLSPKGSFMMIDVLKQTARQDIELAKLAQRRENWDNWQDISDKYYQEHPLKSPFDHSKNLGMDDLKAIGGDVPSPAGTTHKAADKAAYDALPKGAIFTGPDGKQWRKP